MSAASRCKPLDLRVREFTTCAVSRERYLIIKAIFNQEEYITAMNNAGCYEAAENVWSASMWYSPSAT